MQSLIKLKVIKDCLLKDEQEKLHNLRRMEEDNRNMKTLHFYSIFFLRVTEYFTYIK